MNRKMVCAIIVMLFAILGCSFSPLATQAAPTAPPAAPVATQVPIVPTSPPAPAATLVPVLPTESAAPTATDDKAPYPNDLPFSDDFTSSKTGWETYSDSDGSVGYGSGYYFVKVNSSGINMYGRAFENIQDVVMDVDVEQISGPSSNLTGYGMACRMQRDTQNGYYFRIGGDGMYSVVIVNDAGFTSLMSGDKWQSASAINKGNTLNHITVTCNGSQLSLKVNGVTIFSGTDSTYSSGDIGLLGAVYEDNAAAEFHFTKFSGKLP